MDLVKQLEDKKRGCGIDFDEDNDRRFCGARHSNGKIDYCPKCKEIIAILEQAIAEKKKRDKDEIELLKTIEKWICKVTPKMQLDNEILREVCPNIFYNCENRIEQLQSQENEKANDNIALLSTAPKGDVAKPKSSRAINGDGNSPDTSNLLQKQRQEEIEFLQWIYSNNGVEEDFDNVMISIDNRINRLKEQQLNQPKTEE